ncbi:unnamed protein product, partial [Rotaria sordida]
YKNNLIDKSCVNEELTLENCEKYCQCKHQCFNETEQVIFLVPILREPQLIEIYIKKFSRKQQLSKYKDEFVKLIALNFAAIREKAAMVQVYEDMLLIIMAATLIIGITLCYLRSITIALMIITGTALSLGMGCFVYNIIYRIPIFPFLNLMSAFILIGIGCDDIFVFFDIWNQEKLEWLKKYQNKLLTENPNMLLNSTNIHNNIPSNQQKKNPNKLKRSSSHQLFLFKHSEEIRKILLSEEALIEIMSNTLKHAGSSMFVTSFTTSAAFFTNILTNISFIQV